MKTGAEQIKQTEKEGKANERTEKKKIFKWSGPCIAMACAIYRVYIPQ